MLNWATQHPLYYTILILDDYEEQLKETKSNNQLVSNIISLINKYKVRFSDKYSIIVNMGPGSYSSIRISLSVAKGIKIVHGCKVYGYKSDQLSELKLENIEILIKNKQLKDKMINPIYQWEENKDNERYRGKM